MITAEDIKESLTWTPRIFFVSEYSEMEEIRHVLDYETSAEKLNSIVAAKEKSFPMQGGPPIPWSLAELLYVGYVALFGKDQTLERLAERGGFGWGEIEEYWTHGHGKSFREAILKNKE